MLGKELSTGVVNMGLGEPGPRPSYVPAEVLPVPEDYVPSTIDESAQASNKSGARVSAANTMEQSFGVCTPRTALVQWTTLRTT